MAGKELRRSETPKAKGNRKHRYFQDMYNNDILANDPLTSNTSLRRKLPGDRSATVSLETYFRATHKYLSTF